MLFLALACLITGLIRMKKLRKLDRNACIDERKSANGTVLKSGNVKLYTVSTAINMSYLEDFLTSLAEALAHSTVTQHGVSGGLDGPSEGQFRPGRTQD
jgi:hypothetical protein